MKDQLIIGDRKFSNRLFLGSGKYHDSAIIPQIISDCGSEVITVAVRRMDFKNPVNNILNHIPKNISLLINTSGAVNANEAIKIAKIARDAGYGNFIKIEVINDTKYLLPDNEETIKVMVDAGAHAIMPLGSPIGSNRGLLTKDFIEILINQIKIPIIVDAGIGRPSQAAEAMELGASAVLVNTAIAISHNPSKMAQAFALSVQSGRLAYTAGLPVVSHDANASSPLTGFIHG